MDYPHSITVSIPVVVTKCAGNEFGNTEVEATVYGVSLQMDTISGVSVGSAPGQAGFDDVLQKIVEMVTNQIADALRVQAP